MYQRLCYALLWATGDAHAHAKPFQSPTEGLDMFAFLFGMTGVFTTGPLAVVVAVQVFGLQNETLGIAIFAFVAWGLPLLAWFLSLWRQRFVRDAHHYTRGTGHILLYLRPIWRGTTWTWAVLAQRKDGPTVSPRRLAATGSRPEMTALLGCGPDQAFALFQKGETLPA